MRTLRTVDEVRSEIGVYRRDGARIGLVPTMGAFHAGHLSLMDRARTACDVVVVSLFVNPSQFGDAADLSGYPRDESRDAELAAASGADYMFAPAVDEMYPRGFATTVSVAGLTESLEGTHRGREHFDGVATVVTKLFGIVRPDVAFFGDKDAQQARVIERLANDLNLGVEIELCPTVREPDGLAMSSRNARLLGDERARATALSRSLQLTADAVAAGERSAQVLAALARAELAGSGVQTDYFELVDPDTLAPVAEIDGKPVLAVVAARVGDTRLIDNRMLGRS